MLTKSPDCGDVYWADCLFLDKAVLLSRFQSSCNYQVPGKNRPVIVVSVCENGLVLVAKCTSERDNQGRLKNEKLGKIKFARLYLSETIELCSGKMSLIETALEKLGPQFLRSPHPKGRLNGLVMSALLTQLSSNALGRQPVRKRA